MDNVATTENARILSAEETKYVLYGESFSGFDLPRPNTTVAFFGRLSGNYMTVRLVQDNLYRVTYENF